MKERLSKVKKRAKGELGESERKTEIWIQIYEKVLDSHMQKASRGPSVSICNFFSAWKKENIFPYFFFCIYREVGFLWSSKFETKSTKSCLSVQEVKIIFWMNKYLQVLNGESIKYQTKNFAVTRRFLKLNNKNT